MTTLTAELQGLGDKIRVILGDNASTDHTPTVTVAFLTACPTAHMMRRSEKLGPYKKSALALTIYSRGFFGSSVMTTLKNWGHMTLIMMFGHLAVCSTLALDWGRVIFFSKQREWQKIS